MTPAGTSNDLDVQNEWEENTHTHCSIYLVIHNTDLHHSPPSLIHSFPSIRRLRRGGDIFFKFSFTCCIGTLLSPRNSGGIPQVSTRFSLSVEMSRLTRDRTTEAVSRDQILRRRERGQENIHFPCSADHAQDWQPYPVDPYSAICVTIQYNTIYSTEVITYDTVLN